MILRYAWPSPFCPALCQSLAAAHSSWWVHGLRWSLLDGQSDWDLWWPLQETTASSHLEGQRKQSYHLGWRERKQQDATNLMFIVKRLSQHLGIFRHLPIFRWTRLCTAAYGVLHRLCWLWLCGAGIWAVCAVWNVSCVRCVNSTQSSHSSSKQP